MFAQIWQRQSGAVDPEPSSGLTFRTHRLLGFLSMTDSILLDLSNERVEYNTFVIDANGDPNFKKKTQAVLH